VAAGTLAHVGEHRIRCLTRTGRSMVSSISDWMLEKRPYLRIRRLCQSSCYCSFLHWLNSTATRLHT
jgi:hypothetical protein